MIAVDTQILVYAIREDSPFHGRAWEAMRSLAEGPTRWALPWQGIHELIGVCTHPKVYKPPTPVSDVLKQIAYWLESPTASILGESPDHLSILERLIRDQSPIGPRVHDARIAAICIGAGVRELWTADRDFSHFPEVRCRNPLRD